MVCSDEARVIEGTETEFSMINDMLRFCNWVYVPNDDDLRHKILT